MTLYQMLLEVCGMIDNLVLINKNPNLIRLYQIQQLDFSIVKHIKNDKNKHTPITTDGE